MLTRILCTNNKTAAEWERCTKLFKIFVCMTLQISANLKANGPN